MEWYNITLLFIGSFLFLMLLGIPVVYSFLLINIITLYYLLGYQGLDLMILSIYQSITTFNLLPITLFVFMGEVMFRTGIAMNMLDTIDKWISRIPGRLALVAVIGGAIAASLSGASIATTAMLGSSLTPEMEKRGYKRSMSLGPILGSGGLAIMIPPTTLGVILAIISQISVGRLLIGIIIPGLLMALFYALYVIIRCYLQPSIAPPYQIADAPLSEKLILTVKYIMPLGTIIFLVVGLIMLGVATPTEAAALGALGTVVLSIFYKEISFKKLKDSLGSTMRISVMVLTILAGSEAFAQILAYIGLHRNLFEVINNLDVPSLFIIFLMLMVLLILGCFVNGIPLIMITMPIFIPIIGNYGYDPLWFGVIVLITIEMAQTTPPYGILLYVMKGVAPPDTTMSELINSAIPFLVCDFMVILLIILFPKIVIYLPSLF